MPPKRRPLQSATQPLLTYRDAARGLSADIFDLDWVGRSKWLEVLARWRPEVVEMILDELAPDQALGGRNTGKPSCVVIALPNRTERQATLEEFGFHKRQRN